MKRSSGPRRKADLSASIHKQLNMYGLAATASGVGVLALTTSADAKIVYTPAHVRIPPASVIYFDLNHDGINDFYFYRWNALDATRLWIVPVNRENEMWGRASASALFIDAHIGPEGRFHRRFHVQPYGYARMVSCFVSSTGPQCAGPWRNAFGRYLGLKFKAGRKIHYGWARLSIRVVGYDITATLTGYAYETVPNKPIIAGQTKGTDDSNVKEPDAALVSPIPDAPQPATLAALALGAPGLSIWRREDSVAATP